MSTPPLEHGDDQAAAQVGRWFYLVQIDGEFDRLGKLGIDDAASARTARDAARRLFSHLEKLTVRRMVDLP